MALSLGILGITLPAGFCCAFIFSLFRSQMHPWFLPFSAAVSLLYTLIIGLFPLYVYGGFLIPFEIFIIGAGLYLFYAVARGRREDLSGSGLLLLGFAIFLCAIIHDIMKNHGFFAGRTLAHLGLGAFILFQAIIIAKRFSRAFQRVKQTEAEIRGLNDGLEAKVRERTQTIRVILDNVKSGFLLVGSDLNIRPGYTRSCRDILGCEIEVGQNLTELFALSGREKAHFHMAIHQIFQGLLPDEVSLSQIHSRISLGSRVIALQGSVIREDRDQVLAILFTITDATDHVKAEREAHMNRTLISIMQDKMGFKNFIMLSMQELEIAQKALENQDHTVVRMLLHTLKGNFASYGLDELARLVHGVEDLENIGSKELETIIEALKNFVGSYHDVLGLHHEQEDKDGVYVSFQAFDKLRKNLEVLRNPGDLQRVFEIWVEEVKYVPVKKLVAPLISHGLRLAKKLGKELDIDFIGGDVMINPERLGSLLRSLTHLVNNAIDHGIEYPEQRQGKGRRGLITLAFTRNAEELRIELTDDGAGLDFKRIGEIAMARGLVDKVSLEKASQHEIAQYIFAPGFSTHTQVSEVSGRGVGLAALRETVGLLNGSISSKSEQGKGSTFTITIPDHYLALVSSQVA